MMSECYSLESGFGKQSQSSLPLDEYAETRRTKPGLNSREDVQKWLWTGLGSSPFPPYQLIYDFLKEQPLGMNPSKPNSHAFTDGKTEYYVTRGSDRVDIVKADGTQGWITSTTQNIPVSMLRSESNSALYDYIKRKARLKGKISAAVFEHSQDDDDVSFTSRNIVLPNNINFNKKISTRDPWHSSEVSTASIEGRFCSKLRMLHNAMQTVQLSGNQTSAIDKALKTVARALTTDKEHEHYQTHHEHLEALEDSSKQTSPLACHDSSPSFDNSKTKEWLEYQQYKSSLQESYYTKETLIRAASLKNAELRVLRPLLDQLSSENEQLKVQMSSKNEHKRTLEHELRSVTVAVENLAANLNQRREENAQLQTLAAAKLRSTEDELKAAIDNARQQKRSTDTDRVKFYSEFRFLNNRLGILEQQVQQLYEMSDTKVIAEISRLRSRINNTRSHMNTSESSKLKREYQEAAQANEPYVRVTYGDSDPNAGEKDHRKGVGHMQPKFYELAEQYKTNTSSRDGAHNEQSQAGGAQSSRSDSGLPKESIPLRPASFSKRKDVKKSRDDVKITEWVKTEDIDSDSDFCYVREEDTK